MLLAVNLFLTLVWAGLFGSFDIATLTSGFAVTYAFLFLVHRTDERRPAYFSKPLKIAGFICYYLKELMLSNFIVAREIITPPHTMKPGVVALPLEAKTDLEITLLANLITMTPGTLSLDVSEDRKTLYVHAMYVDDADRMRREIRENLERRVLEILR